MSKLDIKIYDYKGDGLIQRVYPTVATPLRNERARTTVTNADFHLSAYFVGGHDPAEAALDG